MLNSLRISSIDLSSYSLCSDQGHSLLIRFARTIVRGQLTIKRARFRPTCRTLYCLNK